MRGTDAQGLPARAFAEIVGATELESRNLFCIAIGYVTVSSSSRVTVRTRIPLIRSSGDVLKM